MKPTSSSICLPGGGQMPLEDFLKKAMEAKTGKKVSKVTILDVKEGKNGKS